MTPLTPDFSDPASVVQAFTEVSIDEWREVRELTTETGLMIKDSRTGIDIRYSALTMSADRLADGWSR